MPQETNGFDEIGESGLSAEESAILEKLIKGQLSAELKEERIPRRRLQSPAPLSFSQQRLWVLDRLVPGNPFYNLPTAFRVTGEIDIPLLERSLNTVIRRHESLRTVFKMENEEPVQVILPEFKIGCETIDLRGLTLPEQEAETARLTVEEAAKPFDLERGPLVRAVLIDLAEGESVLLFNMHHIIFDGWSIRVFIRELAVLYAAFSAGKPSPLPEPPLQYADFAQWQRERMRGEVLEKQLSYWRGLLSGRLPILELPADRQRPAIPSYRGGYLPLELDAAVSAGLTRLSHRQGCSLFTVLLAAFNVLLYRYCGQEDILVGSPIANRNRPELEEMIGFFTNTLVFRTDLTGNPPFHRLVDRVHLVTSGAHDHQDLPFEYLVEQFQPDRYMSHTPLFQVMFNYTGTPEKAVTEEIRSASSGLKIAGMPVHNRTSKFDLWLTLSPRQDRLGGGLEYNTDIFEEAGITRFIGHFQALLGEIAAMPDRRIDDLSLLPPEEKRQILVHWNDNAAAYDIRPLHRAFEDQARKRPHRVAVVAGDPAAGARQESGNRHLSWGELKEKSHRLAHVLRGRGVQADTVVAIMAERSLEMVIGLLGILASGGAYLPIDPHHPEERIKYMLKDSDTRVLLTAAPPRQGDEPAVFPLLSGASPEVLEVNGASTGHTPDEPSADFPPLEERGGGKDNLAYVIYTSGSTGRPKGVPISHAGISNRLRWMQDFFGLTPEDRILQKTPFYFDVSVWEFFWPLSNGAVLVMARPGGHKEGAYLVEAVKKEKITTIHFVPSMLQVFLEEAGIEGIGTLKRIICSGEALPHDYQQRFFDCFRGEVKLYNLYGPTEASVDVTYWACDPHSAFRHVPIGFPVANTRVYILDRHQNPQPIGVPGEIHLAGIQLAGGYLNRPELTAEKFISSGNIPGVNDGNPPSDPTPLYRTGDLGRYRADGSIEFLGRLDFQVKVRGFRIELGEIESKLRRHPLLEEAVVLARGPGEGEGAAAKKLVAYVVLNHDGRPDKGKRKTGPDEFSTRWEPELRDFLKEDLPEYMVPSYFVPLERLPLTPNGKLDRRALPSYETVKKAAGSPGGSAAPRTPTEKRFAGIWKEVLLLDEVGIHDNFFKLGGDSINAIQVVSRANKGGLNLSIQHLYKNQTIAEFAAYIDKVNRQSAPPPGESPTQGPGSIPKRFDRERLRRRLPPGLDIEDIYPLTPFQKHLLHIYRHHPPGSLEPGVFVNQMVVKGVPLKPSDIPLVKKSYRQLADTYPYLRTAFRWENLDAPIQVVYQEADAGFEYRDWTRFSPGELERRIKGYLEADRCRGFERDKPQVYRLSILRTAKEHCLVVLTTDYMRVDGWSADLIRNKFIALLNGGTPDLESNDNYKEYLDWAAEQDDSGGESFWKRMNRGDRAGGGCRVPTPLVVRAPGNRPGLAKGFTFRHIYFSREITQGIDSFLRQNRLTLSVLGSAVWALLLGRYSSDAAVVFGILVSGRSSALAVVESMMGQALNVLPARIDLPPGKPLLDWLKEIWDLLMELNRYEHTHHHKIHEWWGIPPEIPLFESYFVLENFPGIKEEIKRKRGQPLLSLDPGFEFLAQLHYPLRVELFPGIELRLTMHFYRSSFTPESIEAMIDDYVSLTVEMIENPHRTLGELTAAIPAGKRAKGERHTGKREFL